MTSLPSLWKSSQMSERRDPFRAMARIQRDMDRMFGNFMREFSSMEFPSIAESSYQPFGELEDKDTHYLITLEVPGMSKEDIKVELQDNQLHVCGERKYAHEEKGERQATSERRYGAVERWLLLPQNTKPEGIEARIENGLLQVAIPKSEATQPKEIKIGEGKTGVFAKMLEKKSRAA